MMRPVVLQSLEDVTGTRCVDIVRLDADNFGWVCCRRDPEDNHGWRRDGPVHAGFDDEPSALGAARAAHPDCAGTG